MNRTAQTAFSLTSQATRVGFFSLAAIVTALLLSSVSTIADHQVDEVLMAQNATGTNQLVAVAPKARLGV
jgi:hypothetical protein